MKLLKNKRGVTLAELLAVITIMGIIAAIAVPAIGSAINTSKEGSAKADAIAIYEATRVMCTIDETACSGASLDQGDATLQQYLDGATGYTFTVTLSSSKPTLVTLDISSRNLDNDFVTYDGATATLTS